MTKTWPPFAGELRLEQPLRGATEAAVKGKLGQKQPIWGVNSDVTRFLDTRCEGWLALP